MASVIISGDTSGSVTLSAPATAGSNTIVLPSGSGTLTLPTGTATLTANGLNSNIVSGTAQASTSGTSIDLTSIPSWVKRVTVSFASISTNGTNNIQFQLGSGSPTTTGYISVVGANSGSSVGTANSTAGFLLDSSTAAADIRTGVLVVSLLNSATNIWVAQWNCVVSSNNRVANGAGQITLSGALDRVRMTTVTGTDTFDAGSINILYE